MNFEDVHLHEAHQRGQRVGDEVFADFRFLADADAAQRRRRPHLRVLHEEALVAALAAGGADAGRTADERQRTVDHVREDPVGDRFVVVRKVELGRLRFRKEHAVGMRDADAGDDRSTTRVDAG